MIEALAVAVADALDESPEVLKADARQFMSMFPGKTAYAVKTNGGFNHVWNVAFLKFRVEILLLSA